MHKDVLLLIQVTSVPSFLGVLLRLIKAFLEDFPLNTWKEFDFIITNDSWLCAGHKPNIGLVSPIFRKILSFDLLVQSPIRPIWAEACGVQVREICMKKV